MEAPAEVNVNNDANILKTEEPTINGGTAGASSSEPSAEKNEKEW